MPQILPADQATFVAVPSAGKPVQQPQAQPQQQAPAPQQAAPNPNPFRKTAGPPVLILPHQQQQSPSKMSRKSVKMSATPEELHEALGRNPHDKRLWSMLSDHMAEAGKPAFAEILQHFVRGNTSEHRSNTAKWTPYIGSYRDLHSNSWGQLRVSGKVHGIPVHLDGPFLWVGGHKNVGDSHGALSQISHDEAQALLGEMDDNSTSPLKWSRTQPIRFALENMYGWLAPNGNFHHVAGTTHAGWVKRTFGEGKDEHNMFNAGWHRVTFQGNKLWTHNPVHPPTFRQRDYLEGAAIENSMHEIHHEKENGNTREIWNRENFSRSGKPVKFSTSVGEIHAAIKENPFDRRLWHMLADALDEQGKPHFAGAIRDLANDKEATEKIYDRSHNPWLIGKYNHHGYAKQNKYGTISGIPVDMMSSRLYIAGPGNNDYLGALSTRPETHEGIVGEFDTNREGMSLNRPDRPVRMSADHRDYVAAIHANPHDERLAHMYADYLEEQGMPLLAALHRTGSLTSEIQLDPHNLNAWHRMADAMEGAGKPNTAGALRYLAENGRPSGATGYLGNLPGDKQLWMGGLPDGFLEPHGEHYVHLSVGGLPGSPVAHLRSDWNARVAIQGRESRMARQTLLGRRRHASQRHWPRHHARSRPLRGAEFGEERGGIPGRPDGP